MPVDFNGKWTLDRTEGGAAFITALGIPIEKVPKTANLEISQDGDDFAFKIITDTGTRDHNVTVGKPFKESILGFEIDGSAKWDGDRLVTVSDKGSKIIREINEDGELVVTMTVKGVTAKRIFKKC